MDILTNDEIDLLERQTSFQVAEVIKVGLERAYNLAVEKTLCGLPELLNHLAKKTEHLQGLYTKLFTDNPELAKDKETVAIVLQSLELRFPGLSPEELISKIPAAYKSFKETKQVVKTTDLDISQLDTNINGVL